MIRSNIVVLAFCTLLTKCCSQCDNDECYQYYKNVTKHDKEDIEGVFDGILLRYGDIDIILKNLLNTLNNTLLLAEKDLNDFERDNNDIQNATKLINYTIQDLLNDAEIIKINITHIDDSKYWPEEIKSANDIANLIIHIPTTIEVINSIEDELKKWKQFLAKFDKVNYAKDIMNIPHSVSDDINLLETLLNEQHDTDCFDEFQLDLKNLFAQLANTLNIDGVEQTMTNLKKRADRTKKKSNDILGKTQNFLEKERNFNIIHDLANETLILAGEIKDLKDNIDRLMKNNEQIFVEKLKDLQKSHEANLEELYKKYKSDEYLTLLNELNDINNQIDEIGGDKSVNVADIEKEIEEYADDLEYYTCILNDCRYRKPAEAIRSFDCKRKVKTDIV